MESDGPSSCPEPSQPGLPRLLALLCALELNGNLQSELEQLVEKERACLLQDSLLQGLLNNHALRHCLDITLENSMPGKIKVLEVKLKTHKKSYVKNRQISFRCKMTALCLNPPNSDPYQALTNDGQLFSHVVPLLNVQPMLRVDYTATASKLDLLTPYQATLEELAVTSAQWDPLTGPAPASLLGGADLVLCNHAWGPLRMDPKLLLANLSSGAKQGGFVLLHTLLKGETLAETVAFLSNTAQSSNQQGLLTQVNRFLII